MTSGRRYLSARALRSLCRSGGAETRDRPHEALRSRAAFPVRRHGLLGIEPSLPRRNSNARAPRKRLLKLRTASSSPCIKTYQAALPMSAQRRTRRRKNTERTRQRRSRQLARRLATLRANYRTNSEPSEHAAPASIALLHLLAPRTHNPEAGITKRSPHDAVGPVAEGSHPVRRIETAKRTGCDRLRRLAWLVAPGDETRQRDGGDQRRNQWHGHGGPRRRADGRLLWSQATANTYVGGRLVWTGSCIIRYVGF